MTNNALPSNSAASTTTGNTPRSDDLCRADVDTPIGRLGLVASDDALHAILFDPTGPYSDASTHDPAAVDIDLGKLRLVAAEDHPVLGETALQLREYFAGTRRSFDLPLHLVGTDFQREAWKVLVQIPYGETMSYGEQATRMGDPNKARAVGAANGKNRIPIVVPCHRVVGSNGALTGFAGGIDVKSWLLGLESGQARLPVDL